MKIKRFNENIENINLGIPKIGDYVLCEEIINNFNFINWEKEYIKTIELTKNNIGLITSINSDNSYNVLYRNIPEDIIDFFDIKGTNGIREMEINEIKYWSKNKKDLIPENIEIYNSAKNFNL